MHLLGFPGSCRPLGSPSLCHALLSPLEPAWICLCNRRRSHMPRVSSTSPCERAHSARSVGSGFLSNHQRGNPAEGLDVQWPAVHGENYGQWETGNEWGRGSLQMGHHSFVAPRNYFEDGFFLHTIQRSPYAKWMSLLSNQPFLFPRLVIK